MTVGERQATLVFLDDLGIIFSTQNYKYVIGQYLKKWNQERVFEVLGDKLQYKRRYVWIILKVLTKQVNSS